MSGYARPVQLPVPGPGPDAAVRFVREHLADLTCDTPAASENIRGGQTAADAALAALDVTGYAGSRNQVWPPGAPRGVADVALRPLQPRRPAHAVGPRRGRAVERPPEVPRRAGLAGVHPPPLRPLRARRPAGAARGAARPAAAAARGVGRAVAPGHAVHGRDGGRAARRRLAGQPDADVAGQPVDRAGRCAVARRRGGVLHPSPGRLPRRQPPELAVDRRRRQRQGLRVLPLAGAEAGAGAVPGVRPARRLPGGVVARRPADLAGRGLGPRCAATRTRR